MHSAKINHHKNSYLSLDSNLIFPDTFATITRTLYKGIHQCSDKNNSPQQKNSSLEIPYLN